MYKLGPLLTQHAWINSCDYRMIYTTATELCLSNESSYESAYDVKRDMLISPGAHDGILQPHMKRDGILQPRMLIDQVHGPWSMGAYCSRLWNAILN